MCGNIFMGREPLKYFLVMDRKRMERESWEVIERLKIQFNIVRGLETGACDFASNLLGRRTHHHG